MKCITCIWANNINEQVILCPFPNCVQKDGWIADVKRKETFSYMDGEGMDKGLSMRGEDKLPEQDMSVLP